MLFLLLLHWLLWSIVQTKFNLYNTDKTLDAGNLQVNCLHYYNRDTRHELEKTEYCLGPVDDDHPYSDDLFNTRYQNLTFDELRELNVTADDLLSWSATIDLAEKYQFYIDHYNESSVSNEVFSNCNKPWFGPRCQYSFVDKIDSFQHIVRKAFQRIFDDESPRDVPSLTCYTHLKCDRGRSGICLDWREVCDGRIDCVDGADEVECFALEVNECDENEYRCHNGLCIAKSFLGDGVPRCLDQSDIKDYFSLASLSRFPYVFDYEEQACRPGSTQFACGNGECVADFDKCKSQRHLLLIESTSAQGDLSYTCWMAMICLTKIRDRINETSCDQFLRSPNISTYLQTCEELIQFPTVPVLFGYVRFLYRLENHRDLDIDLALIPDYICYDQWLCDFLTPTYFTGSYSCRRSDELGIDWRVKPKSWTSLIGLVERYFRKCLTSNSTHQTNSHYSSLYCCKNSSKCISIHQILDNISDCYLNDDEDDFERSCSIDDILRFQCVNENRCYSSIIPRNICPPSYLRNLDEIQFEEICDRHTEMFPLLIAGRNHTDETDCQELDWPCSNFYTRCDGFWSCPDGEDEENCTTQRCPKHFLPCVSPDNYTLTCLPANQVGDEHIDCVGAVDELQYCRSVGNHLENGYLAFRCLNHDRHICVSRGEICDRKEQCSLGDDEAFCRDQRFRCTSTGVVDRTDVETAICGTFDVKRIAFSLVTLPVYPPSESQTVERTLERGVERRSIQSLITSEPDDPASPRHCNHGLYVRHWLGGHNISYKCFCPPSYYGDRCQYQNQRVAFTARILAMNIRTFYAVVITLVDDNKDDQEINSYHQYISIVSASWDCRQIVNAYLTYATRPNNSSTNYSVRVDVFNKTTLGYLASWHFTVLFPFLPVYRMAVVLHVPAQPVLIPSNCPLTCHNGECIKYMNKDKSFCRCHPGWSGARCNILIRCSDCSNDSICIGMIHNRPICVCPLHKAGLRCSLTLPCPKGICQNNGQCVTLDEGMNELGFACLCPKEFVMPWCLGANSKVEISIRDIKFSSILLIYVFQFVSRSGFEEMKFNAIAQKLTMFQRTVTVHTKDPYAMVFVKIGGSYYLAVLQHIHQENISTSIDSSRRCASNTELLNTEMRAWHPIRRVKYYHAICKTHPHLICFFDEPFMCLCTVERFANCFRLDSTPLKCHDNFHCQHGGECLQDEILCPRITMCNCTDCFFGDRCQFSARGIGLTLDDILRYEIRPHVTMYDQTNIVKWSAAFTMLIFGGGLINSALSILTFRTRQSRDMGCGIYLLGSSITSLLTVSIFTIKFWFLLFTQMNPSISRSVHRGGCLSLEFILKVSLYMDNWLNACVAFDRAVTVYQGVNFNKILSKRIARWMFVILPLLITVSIIHEPLYRDLVDDIEEQRVWCVFYYSAAVDIYNTIILLFHFIGPLCVNLFSALFIIFSSARRGAVAQKRLTYQQHLFQKFKEHKNLIISPIVLVLLMIPRLWISSLSGCVKVSHNTWLYLSGYLISFIPSMTIFFVFVLPSAFYWGQFKESIKSWR